MLFPYHPVASVLPEGCVPYEQWPEYMLESDIEQILRPSAVDEYPRGRRWGRWPFYFEEYISDIEPMVDAAEYSASTHTRIVRWHRVTRTDIPQGWRSFSKKPSKIEGIVDLANTPEFVKHWSKTTRQYYKKWQRCGGEGYAIVETDFQTFAKAYRRSSVSKKTYATCINITKRKVERGNPNILFFTVQLQNKIIAGMSVIVSPTHQASYYDCGFILTEAESVPAMVGLMHYWHTKSLTEGIRFLHLGNFWFPGKPKSWKGFSEFKSKFGLVYIEYPPALYRLQKGSI